MPRSQFYERYLASLAKNNIDPGNDISSTAIDVTSASKSTGATSRRMQIFTSSDEIGEISFDDLETFPKTENSRRFIRTAIGTHYLFAQVDEKELEKIIDCMQPGEAMKNEYIIRQGDEGDMFYCLESGTADAMVDGVGKVATYDRAGCFGELALIYNCPRAASVIATTTCTMWKLTLRTFRTILASQSSEVNDKRVEFLKKCLFLDPLTTEQIGKVAVALSSVEFNDNDIIVKQDDEGDTFYIIEDGAVKCTQRKADGREVELVTLRSGDYFGEMALMLNEKRLASCTAIGHVRLLSLTREHFNLLLGSVQDVLASRMRIRILQSVPLLAKMPEVKLVRLAGAMRVQTFAPDSYIIRQGDEGSRFFIISEGEVRCTRTISGGQEEELIRLGAHEFFGEKALIANELRKANVIALNEVECLVLDRGAFQAMLADVSFDGDENKPRRRDEDEFDEPLPAYIPRTNFSFSDLKIIRTIGQGTFGRVKLVQHMPTGRVLALKCMDKSHIEASHQTKNVMSERDLLSACSDCPFILTLLQTFNHPSQLCMLMEFVQGGELWTFMYERKSAYARSPLGGIAMPAIKFIAANVLLAFKYMHERQIAFRDLKPENLLISNSGYLKIVDFGFAKKIPYFKNGKRTEKTFTLCGTPEYLAPEIIMSKGYDKSVDCWAFGCLLYELYVNRTPFQAEYTPKIFQNIVASFKTLSFPARMDPHHVSLIKKLLQFNPVFRIGNLSGGIDDILEDPFFSTVDIESIRQMNTTAPFIPKLSDELDSSAFDPINDDIETTIFRGDQSVFDGF
jgi:CRP-like cAMP-binding protein/serine/threonine protein kinase